MPRQYIRRRCSVDGCEKPHYCRDFCQMHYSRWYRHGDPHAVTWPQGPAEDRFWSKVEKTDTCWEWTAATMHGYGVFGVGDNRYQRAHRFSWEMHFGPIENGLWVLHKCDNPLCVRPDHLFLGTHQDNMNDAQRKGRNAHGERAGGARLTEGDIRRIRQLAENGMSHTAIAHEFGVHQPHISKILRGEIWKHVA